MKLVKINKFYLLGVFLLTILGCSKEDDPDPIPQPVEIVSWSKSEFVDQGLANTKLFGTVLKAVSGNAFFNPLNLTSANFPISFQQFQSRIGRYKLPISEKAFITRTEREVFVFNPSNLNLENAIKLNMVDIDPEFLFFEDIPLWEGEAFGLLPSGTAFIPYRSLSNGLAVNTPSFLLIKTDLENDRVVIRSTQVIKENLIDYYVNCEKIESHYDNFYIQLDFYKYKFDTNGNFSRISENKGRIFKYQEGLMSIEIDSRTGNIVARTSDRNGTNWSVIGTVEYNQLLSLLDFTEIDGKVIGFFGNEIFQLTIGGGTIRRIELENKGLSGRINAITELPNNEILISTSCNSPAGGCGAYTKSKADFFKEKQIQN
ncbi:hypothetical protein BC751_2596 [Cecembia calidifontis]|jgi:hypothetical protein|uniref:Uncharacterized protein n=2 Tax=Cecembia calidifontis TaxID=1187080 RepID=A0A4V2F6P1_9BACT|nr:hypothetical protein BC751_2596 [Cecembia calidifontis]